MKLLFFFTFVYLTNAKSTHDDKLDFCLNLNCDDGDEENVCGIREEGAGFKLRLFNNMCELFKFGCVAKDEEAYGLINLEYCKQTFKEDNEKFHRLNTNNENDVMNEIGSKCPEFNCKLDDDYTCSIRHDVDGFRIRLFKNKCEMMKYNCENDVQFNITDAYICDGVVVSEIKDDTKVSANNIIHKNLFIIDSMLLNYNENINETIDNFFAATHVLDLPVKEIQDDMNEEGRRMILSRFGPQKVFRPWISKPANITNDYYHRPTLSTCFHKCPVKCPDTYAPVCGNPGILAREPSLMFQNHCFMDVAQCKMHWEDKSETALSSSYVESSFLFCLGDQLNGLYTFLPLVKTLQHMGRLKKKGHFRYKLRNFRYFNDFLLRQPKLMG